MKALFGTNILIVPDAITRATAQTEGRRLVTRNSKDFPAFHPDVRVLYVI